MESGNGMETEMEKGRQNYELLGGFSYCSYFLPISNCYLARTVSVTWVLGLY